jgi:FKBP-type peptidyl-prolyl cis-trans isomerase 2
MFVRMNERYRDYFGQNGEATGPENVLAGYAGLFPGSGYAVLGLHKGERRTVTVASENAFGPKTEDKIKTYARRRILPKTVVLTVDAFMKKFSIVPEKGKEVRLSPYFPSRVTVVQDGVVNMKNLFSDGEVIEDTFGHTTIADGQDAITITIDPTIGAAFETGEKKGIVTGKEADEFYVDYNHPLAGKNLIFDVMVRDLKKFSFFDEIDIPWNEDHDTAMELAAQENKPLVLVLYAEWCQWSQRLLTHTCMDPRVKQYHDRFVWLKIDSDKEPMYKEVFEQDGFPMIVLMDAKGEILEKLGGFQDAGTLALALKKVIGKDQGVGSDAHALKIMGQGMEKSEIS